ncbi:MAG TPA: YidC/Oxa1 family membrane protein insertase [Thermoleophilaceae bacterium]|jgi:YidC/Oxa1 family membrane protein insertase|nr:YidC/Oxa1 family membrane protein insertase [Thermoleophilaceae bacterium]
MLPVANVLQPLIDFCESILTFWHDTVGFSWGLSIIFLTFVIRLLILPLTFKQVRSMQSLQRLQPEIKKIQERYKDDKQRMNQEMMKFYQEHKVNPLSSCLPILLQLPFFLALFYMLRHDLRMDVCGQTAVPCGQVPGAHGEGFLFIPDITDKATGAALGVLLVLYVGSQLVSGLITTFTADRSQRIMMLALPFVFVTFVINFPAGLILYWITTNFWTIGQQLAIKKFLPPPEPIAARAPAGAVAATDGKSKKPAKPSKAEASGSNGAKAAQANQASKAPPPGPRKKKKRSGRRR